MDRRRVCLSTVSLPHPRTPSLRLPEARQPLGVDLGGGVLAYRDTGGGAGADAVHFGKGLRGAEALALAQVAAHGLFVGLSRVAGLLLLVASVQLVQGLFHLLHDRLVIVLQAWEEDTPSGDEEDS